MANPIAVVYNANWSTLDDQRALHSLLPVNHQYGDRISTLADGRRLLGSRAHDDYCPRALRVRCRKRATCLMVRAHSRGGYGPHRQEPLDTPLDIMACFVAVPDWQAEGLDAEAMFLRHVTPDVSMANRVGPSGNYTFDFNAYIMNTAEDIFMGLWSLRQHALAAKSRVHLKMAPLAVGPSIRTRFGDPLAPLLMPAYVQALSMACHSAVNATWIHTLELIDFTRGQLTPSLRIKGVRIMSGARRDAFDFSGIQDAVLPAILAPCDAFARVGLTVESASLSACMANNSNMRQVLQQASFVYVPFGQPTLIKDDASNAGSNPCGGVQPATCGPTSGTQASGIVG